MKEVFREWGRNIERGRAVLGLTQVQLGKACGVHQSTIAKWEAGDMVPRDHHKVAIATALHQDVRQLFPLTRSAA